MKREVLVLVVVVSAAGMLLTGLAHGEETYRFERLWPVLQQPWHFIYPYGAAVDGAGNVYVADTGNNRIQ